MRFDLAIFAPLRIDRLIETNYKRAARSWWNAQIRIRYEGTWQSEKLSGAANKLVERFLVETASASDPNAPSPKPELGSQASVLTPQVILVGLLAKDSIPSRAIRVTEDPPLWLYSDSKIFPPGAESPELVFIVLEEEKGVLSQAEFESLRRLRRELTWLHADLQYLVEVHRLLATGEISADSKAMDLAKELAQKLSQLSAAEERGFEHRLLNAWLLLNENKLSRARLHLARNSDRSSYPLPIWLESTRKSSAPQVDASPEGEVSGSLYPEGSLKSSPKLLKLAQLCKTRNEKIQELRSIILKSRDGGGQNEREIQTLLESNPWILNPEYTSFLSANQTVNTVFRRLANTLGIDEVSDPQLNNRPDLVLLDAKEKHLVVVELKSINLKLGHSDLGQLKAYMERCQEWLEAKNLRLRIDGYLIGTVPDTNSTSREALGLRADLRELGSTSRWCVISYDELLRKAEAANQHLLDVA